MALLDTNNLYKAPPAPTIQGATISDLPPVTPVSSVLQNYDTGPVKVSPESSVSQQLATLLGSESPYIKANINRANERANQLGLLSSSMAVGAGNRAAIDAALPIAKQDAEFRQNLDIDANRYTQNLGLNQQQARSAQELSLLQARNAGALTKAEQQAMAQREQAQQQIQYSQLKEQNRAAQVGETEVRRSAMVREAEATRANKAAELFKDRSLAQDLIVTNLQLSQKENDNYGGIIDDIMSNYSAAVVEIQANKEMSPAQKAIALNNIEIVQREKTKLVAAIYNKPKFRWNVINWK